MANLVIDYLENAASKWPNNTAFVDLKNRICFSELRNRSHRVADFLIEEGLFKKPVLIFMEKNIDCVVTFFGCAYSGNFYSPLDTKMPASRVNKIIDTLQPSIIITNHKNIESVKEFSKDIKTIEIEDVLDRKNYDLSSLMKRTQRIIDTDILYVLFTSGSTGIPKGVIINHKAVIDYVEWITHTYNFDETTVFGNQAQLYFDLSIQDVYAPLKTGGATVLIPNKMFAQPLRVWKMILENKVNTLVWIPSMLSNFANLDILANVEKAPLRKVLFCGEVMPTKQLNYWIRNYPDVTFANLYGPTEATDACAYYTIDRVFSDDDVLPMGKACENSEIFVIDEDGQLVTSQGKIGELYIRGTALSMGYYNDPEKTKEVFIQNPLNPFYPEIVYRTGDLVRYNEYNELVYVSRKDFQIKHRGYRIELGEIDAAATSIPEIEYACCLYDIKQDKLILVYKGETNPETVKKELTLKLQEYMVPTEYYQRESMLFNINGKIDRKALEKEYCTRD